MKTLKQLILCSWLILPVMNTSAAPKPIDKVIAIVDKNVILHSELEERVIQVAKQARSKGLALPDINVLQAQIIDHLISEQLQLQTARRFDLRVDDQQVNQAIDNIRLSNKMSLAQFNNYLEVSEGISISSFREKIRKEITIQQIQQGLIQQRIHISPLELDNFLKSADAQFWMSPEYHLGHILIGLPQSATAADIETAKQKALALADKINKGANFAEVAIAESKGPSALQGGDLGWRKTSALPSLFAKIVPDLAIGQVSEPARSPAGFHLLKLYEKKGEQQQTETQAKLRHILVKTSAILDDKAAEQKLKKIRDKILDGADFATLAKENSEDIGSMLAGGDLGSTNPAVFVPAFQKIAREAKVGEISQPFKSRFGWHIMQVEDRRQEDITEAVLRNKASQILTSRRFEDELQIWLRELRDEAFVDIKI